MYMKRAYLSAIGDLKRRGEDPIMGAVRQGDKGKGINGHGLP